MRFFAKSDLAQNDIRVNMLNTILGQKQSQTQKFLEDGTRIPVTEVLVSGNIVVAIKNKEKNGYWSLQLGFGIKKHANKAILGHIRGANLKTAPQYLREIRIAEENLESLPKLGDVLKVADIFKPGDIIDVIGVSKGKGFAGVVKRYHFKGGPRTHGQSDRERAPGSIGQSTTPGRVYKGKRMAGKMGDERVTVKNLKVVDVAEDKILIKGLIPGSINNLVIIKKVGESKKFIPLYKKPAIIEAQNKTETHDLSVSKKPSTSVVARKTPSNNKKSENKEIEGGKENGSK